MTCAVNWIIVRERCAESTSLSHTDLAGSRVKTVSGHLELSPDAVDDYAINNRYLDFVQLQFAWINFIGQR